MAAFVSLSSRRLRASQSPKLRWLVTASLCESLCIAPEDQFMKAALLAPLGMRDTFFQVPDSLED